MNRKEKADLLVTNGKIYTVDSSFSVAGAMAILDGRIIATGSVEELMGRYTAADTLDAEGRAVFPGFIDAHCHFAGYARNLQFADLTGCKSFDEVVARLHEFRRHYKGVWLAGRGWDQNLWESKSFPDRELLDREFPGEPVILVRIDGHIVLASDEALRLAGLGLNHRFAREEVEIRNGRLTGILSERAADYMRATHPEPDDDVMTGLLYLARQECSDFGLTMVSDAGLSLSQVLLLDSLQRAEKLPIRVHVMLSPEKENLDYFLPHGPYKTDQLNVCAIKAYADGSLGGRTALLKSEYSDAPGTFGVSVISDDSLQAICTLALKHGFQVCTHAIGDSANRFVLEIYGRNLKASNDLRWRIEHAQVVDPADRHLFGKYSIVPSVQATHATSDMYWAEDRLGPKRMEGAYAYRSLMMQNGWIPNGTDFPIEKINPMLTFYAAVERKDLNGTPPGGFLKDEALNREEALRSMTIWAAKACRWENELGSLEAGKAADFVILDRDIMQVTADDIPAAKVMAVYLGGRSVRQE